MGWGCTIVTCRRPRDSTAAPMASVSCVSGDTGDPLAGGTAGEARWVLLRGRHRPAAPRTAHGMPATGGSA